MKLLNSLPTLSNCLFTDHNKPLNSLPTINFKGLIHTVSLQVKRLMIKGLNLRFVYTGELVSIEEENSLEYVVPGYAGYSSLTLSCRCLARLLDRDPGGGAQGMGGTCCVQRDCALITSLMKTSEYDLPVQLSAPRSRWLIVR